MAKTHWHHSVVEQDSGIRTPVWGCQHSACKEPATHQWQRSATDDEVAREYATQGPYGQVIRSWQGPHTVAVFACAEHALHAEGMANTHGATCPAPDPGCDCNDQPRSESPTSG